MKEMVTISEFIDSIGLLMYLVLAICLYALHCSYN